MARYLVRRLTSMVVVVLLVVSAVFLLTRLIPADPARIAAGLDAGPKQVEAVRVSLGLNRPLWVQFAKYLVQLFHLDLGKSIMTQQPVVNDLKRYAPATFELAGCTMIVLVLLSIPLGVVSATSARVGDVVIRSAAIVGNAIPPFWLALLLQTWSFSRFSPLPSEGQLPITSNFHPVTGLLLLDSLIRGRPAVMLTVISHLILPVFALLLGRLAVSVRLIRTLVLLELDRDYVRTARAKGLKERTILYRHVLPNALIPVVTMYGVQLGYLLGGTFLIEVIFDWPGLGRYVVEAISDFDYNAITATALLMALSFVVINLFLDVLYVLLDPRVRVR